MTLRNASPRLTDAMASFGRCELLVADIHGDDRRAVTQGSTLNGVETDATRTDDDDLRAGFDPGGIHDRSEPRDDAAGKQR